MTATLELPRSWDVAAPDADEQGPGWLSRWRTRREVRLDGWIDEVLYRQDTIDLRWRWQQACVRAGLGQAVHTPLGGFGQSGTPLVTHVQGPVWGSNGYLMVKRPPGLTLGELEDAGEDIAAGLGCWAVRFSPRGQHHVRVDMISTDPLSAVLEWLPRVGDDEVVVGVDEHAEVIVERIDRLTHLVAQGSTRSGKSWWCYALLAQLARRRELFGDVEVVGVDPTGLLLGPWGAHRWRACGTDRDAAGRYAAALAGLVQEMDDRIRTMPPRCDVLPTTRDTPLIFVVLEEWAGVGRIVKHSRSKPAETHQLVARLVAEGAKVGIRVVTLVQRAEADVVGAFERDQALTKITFGSGDANTVKLLHADVSAELAELHSHSPVGVALMTAPGRPLVRFRGPSIGSYGAYVDAVCPNDGAVVPPARLHDQAA